MGVRDELRAAGLVRPRQGRVIAGVCAGLARRLGVDPWHVRVIAIVSLFLPGPQFVAYIVLWILMPPDPP
jgi:phage shock protein PspC (stress-responsive transcriptional regulator)